MILPRLVVDSNVVLKWYRQDEEAAGEARFLQDQHLDGRLVLCAPDLLLYEFGNVLRHKTGMTPEKLADYVESLRALDMLILPIGWDLLDRAARIAIGASPSNRPGMTVYDASYVALAEAIGCRFVTADRRLFSLAQGHPLVRLLSAELLQQLE